MSDPIRSRLDTRRALLAERMDCVLEARDRGDGSTTWLELEVIADEMAFLLDLYRTLCLMHVHERLLSEMPR